MTILGDLPRKALVNYKETIDGVDYDVQYMVYCTALENPYGNDCCLMLRLRATGRGGLDERCKFSDNGSVEYERSVLDDFLTNEYAARFDENFLQAVKPSDVKCFSVRDGSTYVLHRQFFVLSLNELGISAPYDPSDNLRTFQYSTDRIARLLSGEVTRVPYWTRSPASDSAVGYVNINGYLNTNNPAGNYYARPSFNLDSSTLVSSEPNEDGSYDLILSPKKEIVLDPAKFESSFALLLS